MEPVTQQPTLNSRADDVEEPKRMSVQEYQSVLVDKIANQRRCSFRSKFWTSHNMGTVYALDGFNNLDYILVEGMRFLERDTTNKGENSKKLYQRGYANIENIYVENALRSKILAAFRKVKPDTKYTFEDDCEIKLRFISTKTCTHSKCAAINENFTKKTGLVTLNNKNGETNICTRVNKLYSDEKYKRIYISQFGIDGQEGYRLKIADDYLPATQKDDMDFFNIHQNTLTGILVCKPVGIYIPTNLEPGCEPMADMRLRCEISECYLKSPFENEESQHFDDEPSNLEAM